MRKPSFIKYFIRRKNTLPWLGREIEFIAANQAGLRKARIPKWTGFLMGIPVALVPTTARRNRRPAERRFLLVKLKNTGAMEEWLEDYLEFHDPDWHLMGVINRLRATRVAKLPRALDPGNWFERIARADKWRSLLP